MPGYFEPDASEVFNQAGVDPKDAPELFRKVVSILGAKMATLSVTMGMSWKRVGLYAEQKEALVQDLIESKAAGTLR